MHAGKILTPLTACVVFACAVGFAGKVRTVAVSYVLVCHTTVCGKFCMQHRAEACSESKQRYGSGSMSLQQETAKRPHKTNNMASSHTGQGYRINSKQSARRVDCRADDSPSPSPLPHQSHQQEDAIKCSAMPQVTITTGIEHSGIMIRDTSNIEENKSQSKVVAGTVNSKEQSQSHVYQWRNQQLMRGERPRAAVAPICGTLPGTLVDPIRGPPPASVGDENRPNCRQYDHLVVPYGIYCTLVALASLSFSTVFLISFVQAKRGDYYTSTSWAPYIWHFAILILTGCAAMHLIVAIIGVSHNGNNLVLPMLWKDQMCGRCDREVCWLHSTNRRSESSRPSIMPRQLFLAGVALPYFPRRRFRIFNVVWRHGRLVGSVHYRICMSLLYRTKRLVMILQQVEQFLL